MNTIEANLVIPAQINQRFERDGDNEMTIPDVSKAAPSAVFYDIDGDIIKSLKTVQYISKSRQLGDFLARFDPVRVKEDHSVYTILVSPYTRVLLFTHPQDFKNAEYNFDATSSMKGSVLEIQNTSPSLIYSVPLDNVETSSSGDLSIKMYNYSSTSFYFTEKTLYISVEEYGFPREGESLGMYRRYSNHTCTFVNMTIIILLCYVGYKIIMRRP